MDASILSFLALSAVVIATPGPDTALTVRNTIAGGRRGGIATALGVATGQTVWSLGTSLGLFALLLASEAVFRGFRLAGAACLAFLGVQSLLWALRGRPHPAAAAGPAARSPLPFGRAFRQGLVNNLANPKMAAFFAGVMPQFAPAGDGMMSRLVALGLVFSALTLAWLALYAVVVARTGRLVRESRMVRAADGISGLALLGLGIRVAAEES